MFRHCRGILRELVINIMPSYTSIANANVGNTICNSDAQQAKIHNNYETPG
jgi:hypothetical protein